MLPGCWYPRATGLCSVSISLGLVLIGTKELFDLLNKDEAFLTGATDFIFEVARITACDYGMWASIDGHSGSSGDSN